MSSDQFAVLKTALDSPKWTETFTVIIIGLTAAFTVASIIYARWQLLADHKRSEKRTAVEMCMKWTEFTVPESSSMTRLIERLSPEQADAISKITRLIVSKDNRHHLINILQSRFPDVESTLDTSVSGDNYIVEGRQLQYIRHVAVRYLNMLESVLLAWAEGIADHDVIVREFDFIWDETDSRTAMEELRRKVGFESFPSIALFISALREKRSRGLPRVPLPSLVSRR